MWDSEDYCPVVDWLVEGFYVLVESPALRQSLQLWGFQFNIAIAACICLLTICYSSKLTTLQVENANEDIEGNWDFNVKELTVLNNLIDKRVNKENKIGERQI